MIAFMGAAQPADEPGRRPGAGAPPPTREPLRVLIVDDHPVFLDGLGLLLRSEPDLLVSEAADGAAAIEAAAATQPDVVVMDLDLPGLGGVEATRAIVRASPHIGVLVLTMFDDDESVFAAMRAGARGYLLKGSRRAEILQAVRAVAEGTALFGPTIARRLIEYFAQPRPAPGAEAFPELTEREREILDLIAQGVPNTGIAQRLYLSPKTVRNHVSNIFAKLQVSDRAQAIVRARRAGLGGDAR
jgi:DNA-binding NarL/FixJ family response regulator